MNVQTKIKEKSHGLFNYCSIGTACSNEAVQIRPGKQRPTLSISLGLSDCECGNHGGGATALHYVEYKWQNGDTLVFQRIEPGGAGRIPVPLAQGRNRSRMIRGKPFLIDDT